ncbi:hypothetical protein [Komagataeibacter nataicola]|nr:hypothetical protein [Komagataeibacter nataicola]GBR23523.1 hypothetical protein AA0616_2543 [Komagataeibacter nataicola NRIC 0616]
MDDEQKRQDAIKQEQMARDEQMAKEQMSRDDMMKDEAIKKENMSKEQMLRDDMMKEATERSRQLSEEQRQKDEQRTKDIHAQEEYWNKSKDDFDNEKTPWDAEKYLMAKAGAEVPVEASKPESLEGKYSKTPGAGAGPADWEKARMQALARDNNHQNERADLDTKESEFKEKGDDYGAKMTGMARERETASYKADVWNDIANKEYLMRGETKEYKEYKQERDQARQDAHTLNDAMVREQKLQSVPFEQKVEIPPQAQAEALARLQETHKAYARSSDMQEKNPQLYATIMEDKQQSPDAMWQSVAENEKALHGETATYKLAMDNMQFARERENTQQQDDTQKQQQPEPKMTPEIKEPEQKPNSALKPETLDALKKMSQANEQDEQKKSPQEDQVRDKKQDEKQTTDKEQSTETETAEQKPNSALNINLLNQLSDNSSRYQEDNEKMQEEQEQMEQQTYHNDDEYRTMS